MEELVRQRDDLKKKLRELDNLAETGTEKILNAIKSQRWFFFENNKYILFDRDTALIWANLNYFPFNKTGGSWYYNEDINPLIKQINSQRWGGLDCWRIPGFWEFLKMIMDKTFPFHEGEEWEILGRSFWFIDNDGSYWDKIYLHSTKSCERPKPQRWSDGRVLPCNDTLVPPEYEQNISPSNRFYSQKEKLQFTLDIFTRNNLIPKFNDYSAAQTYKKLYVDKVTSNRQRILNQIAELERKIDAAKKQVAEEARRRELEASKPKLTANFDYRPLLSKYDVAAVNKSVIKYSDAVLKVTDEFLDILQDYETAQSSAIANSLQITLKLSTKYTDHPNLTVEENKLLFERQKLLLELFDLGLDKPKRRILSVKAQGETLSARIKEINDSDDMIRELGKLEAEPRANFELLVENMARIIRDVQQRVDFFAMHKEFVSDLVKAHIGWSNDYKAFKTSLRTELASICRKENIDDEVFAAWYEDWQKKRLAIEQRFLPLVEFGLKGALSEAVSKVLWFLGEYRGAVDKFYLHERKNIYQKFAFVPGGDLQEKFETESALYKLSEKFQRDLQGIIFACDKTEERIFLLRWAEPILNLPIDEISNFIRDKELDTIAEEVLTQLAELRHKNFAEYLADSKAYSDAAQKREKEFNALIFRMRKDLNKK